MIEMFSRFGSTLVESKEGVAQIYFWAHITWFCMAFAIGMNCAKRFHALVRKETSDDGDAEIGGILVCILIIMVAVAIGCAVSAVEDYATMMHPAYYLLKEGMEALH